LKYVEHWQGDLPKSILNKSAKETIDLFKKPTLIEFDGVDKSSTIYLSVLMHGNESSGWEVFKELLREYYFAGKLFPKKLIVFVANPVAAQMNKRHLESQNDFNRVWTAGESKEHKMAEEVMSFLKERSPLFAAIDLHNNSGRNPFFACVNVLRKDYLKLAKSFSSLMIYFTEPAGAHSIQLAKLGPALTLECGLAGDPAGIQAVLKMLQKCFVLDSWQNEELGIDFDVFHIVAQITFKAKKTISLATNKNIDTQVKLLPDLDLHNFKELAKGSVIANLNNDELPLHVLGLKNEDLACEYFEVTNNNLVCKKTFIPSMLSAEVEIIKQDCLAYVMEKLSKKSYKLLL